MSCGIGHRHGSDSASTTLIRPLAWEPPYAVGAALKKWQQQQQQQKTKDKKKKKSILHNVKKHMYV